MKRYAMGRAFEVENEGERELRKEISELTLKIIMMTLDLQRLQIELDINRIKGEI